MLTISEPVLITLIGLLITSILAPLVLGFFNRGKDGTALAQNALTVANQAVTDLQKANEEIQKLKEDQAKLRGEKTAPIRIAMTIYRDPNLVVRDVEAAFLEESEAR